MTVLETELVHRCQQHNQYVLECPTCCGDVIRYVLSFGLSEAFRQTGVQALAIDAIEELAP